MIMEESYNLLSELETPEHMVSLQSTSEGLRTKKANDEKSQSKGALLPLPSAVCRSQCGLCDTRMPGGVEFMGSKTPCQKGLTTL